MSVNKLTATWGQTQRYLTLLWLKKTTVAREPDLTSFAKSMALTDTSAHDKDDSGQLPHVSRGNKESVCVAHGGVVRFLWREFS